MIILFLITNIVLINYRVFGNEHEGVYQPKFATPIVNLSIAIGREAIFKCKVHHLGKYKVGWVKADTKAIQAIDKTVITHNSRVSVTHESHNVWNLHIRDVRDDDKGVYMCQINTDPMINQIGHLNVLIPPDFRPDQTSSDVLCTEGSTVRLKCTAQGRPQPRITWRREDAREIILRSENRPFYELGEYVNTFRVSSFEGEILKLSKISRGEMGPYLCIASNGVPPSISKRITVHVHFPPTIYVPNQLVGTPLSTQVTLECLIESYPLPITYWVHNSGHIITTNAKYDINIIKKSQFEVNMILTIKNIISLDLGTYKCVAKNSLGETENNIRLYEILGPTIFPFVQNYEDVKKQPEKNKSRKNIRINIYVIIVMRLIVTPF